MLFRNFYRCARCGQEWTDVWPAQCDDDCYVQPPAAADAATSTPQCTASFAFVPV